ncbi:solute carrier family 22 member 3 [Scaptodrosophila lebanonensis]|uniref:Solute carrier family 22 member 3 n=1 Tax=Drosophila lebanonensis TaxID=7225 RepID=A0A6J2TGQ3_DROLE|nr:solute carrier family 22 member 3 [Scaptodrosophila lebanonensis]
MMQNQGFKPKTRRLSPIPNSHWHILTHPAASTEDVRQTETVPKDIVHHILGDFGIWQLRGVLIILLCKIPIAWFMANILFTAPEIYPRKEFSCDARAYGVNSSISGDQCFVLVSHPGRNYVMHHCHKFQYAQSFHSLLMEFDLACLGDIFVAWSQYWHLFGLLVGGIASTKLLRVLSPRTVYGLGVGSLIALGLIMAYLIQDFSQHCALRCLSGVCCALMGAAGRIVVGDIIAGRHRLIALLLYDSYCSLALLLLPAMASLASNWRQVYLYITLPLFVLLILLPYTPESPRWLLQHSRYPETLEQVGNLVLQAAHVNDRCFKIPADFHEQLHQLQAHLQLADPPPGWLSLWQGRGAKLQTFAAHVALAMFFISHMGLLLNIRAFGRKNMTANMLAIGLSELLGCVLALNLSFKRSSHKWKWAGGLSILAGCLGCLCWLNAHLPAPYVQLSWLLLSSLPTIAVSSAQAMLLGSLEELVPSKLGATFEFSLITWSRLWMLSAAFLTLLRQWHVAVPLSIFCTLLIVGGICTCFLVTRPREERQVKQLTGQRAGSDCYSSDTHI